MKENGWLLYAPSSTIDSVECSLLLNSFHHWYTLMIRYIGVGWSFSSEKVGSDPGATYVNDSIQYKNTTSYKRYPRIT